jgi:RNA polymerase sigma-70 factor (ECF subfamily)
MKPSRKRREFETSALQHLDALYGVALKLTRDEQNAKDLVQDTYVRALRFYDRFEWGTNMRAWLLRILTNMFINRYRQAQKEKQLADTFLGTATHDAILSTMAMGQLRDPERRVMDGMLRDALIRAFDELPDEFRMTVVLADVYGFSYKEIAEIIDRPIGTVMSRLHRARRALQEKLLDQAVAAGLVTTGPASPEAPQTSTANLAEYRTQRRRRAS